MPDDDLTERLAAIGEKRRAYLKRHPDKTHPLAGCPHEHTGVVEPVADPPHWVCRDCGWLHTRETVNGRTILTAVAKEKK
jgi:hypothetical protein